MSRILITGGSGFIGTNLVLSLLKKGHCVFNLDKLTYAAYPNTPKAILENANYKLLQGDIADSSFVSEVIHRFRPEKVVHLAAESHVDNSIKSADSFIQTNIVGTFNLLESSRHYFQGLKGSERDSFLFYLASTGSVHGKLTDDIQGSSFSEKSRYNPIDTYSATKAASEHLALSYCESYKIPVIVGKASTTYGQYDNPKALIPQIIQGILSESEIHIPGDSSTIIDWIHVEDHVRAIELILTKGEVGQVYNISSMLEKNILDLAIMLCDIAQYKLHIHPKKINSFTDLVVQDPTIPTYATRYSLDNSKIKRTLGWKPLFDLNYGLLESIQWTVNQKK